MFGDFLRTSRGTRFFSQNAALGHIFAEVPHLPHFDQVLQSLALTKMGLQLWPDVGYEA